MATTSTRPLRAENLDQLSWHYWGINDIYTGPTGSGQWVPNVGDKVFDGLRDYRVTYVDEVTLLSTLTPLTTSTGGIDEEDILLSTGPGTYQEGFRLYIDNRTVPQTMVVDSRLRLYGTKVRYVKVFLGNNITEDGHVISAMYDASGNKTSEDIPTELVIMPSDTNLGVQTVRMGYCADTVNTGDVATLVAYSAEGVPMSVCNMILVNTSFIRTLDASKRYITNIELISDFIDPNDRTLLKYPLNMVKQSDAYYAKLTYSDGTVSDNILVDGDKVRLLGIDSFIASQVGQLTKLRLTYKLNDDEYAMDTTAPLPDRTKQVEYRLLTVESDNSYSVMIYVVPRWNSASLKWELGYWLYDLERDMVEDITASIEIGATSAPFVGDNYTTPQELVVAFNMANLGSSYTYYRHVQTFTINLFGPGAVRTATDYWSISYSNNLSYGNGLLAYVSTDSTPNTYRIDLSVGRTTLTEWLRVMYWQLSPMYLTTAEDQAPEPTHVRVRIGATWVREVAVADLLQPITGVNAAIVHGQPIRLEFIRKTGNTDLELALGSLTARV